jgi:transcriptional antiterminator NusG
VSDEPNKVAAAEETAKEDKPAEATDSNGAPEDQQEHEEATQAAEAAPEEVASPIEPEAVQESSAADQEVEQEEQGEVAKEEVGSEQEETGEEDAQEEDAQEEDAQEEDAQEGNAEEDVEEEVAEVVPVDAAVEEPTEEIKMDWYILKVQSNREKSISAALRRKIAVEGLDKYFGDVVVPMEKVTEFKGGKKKVVERKLYPGYIVVNMHINDDTWFAVRETSGIGDFTGSGGKPTPMLPHEVARIIQTDEEVEEEAPKLNISFKLGDRVKVKEGTFESFEGEVNNIDEQSGRITVMINIFGRSTPVELEYWQAEQV